VRHAGNARLTATTGVLPGGEPVRLTHDGLNKIGPVYSPDGSRIAYTVVPNFDTWIVPVLGGEPRPMLPNASGLTWIDGRSLMFSEIKSGMHMAVVTSTESRSEERDIYVPPRERGMAHRSYLSPDGKWVLLAEMDNGGWLPCRLVPFAGSSPGNPVGRDLPSWPDFAANSSVDPGKLPGVEVIDHEIAPGFTQSTHTFTRKSVHRNLYRIPLP